MKRIDQNIVKILEIKSGESKASSIANQSESGINSSVLANRCSSSSVSNLLDNMISETDNISSHFSKKEN
jgi:hypothetical protein